MNPVMVVKSRNTCSVGRPKPRVLHRLISCGFLLGLIGLSGCLLQDPERLDFATDPHILRGSYEGKLDTRLGFSGLSLTADASTLVVGDGDGKSMVQLWDTEAQAVRQTLGQRRNDYIAVDDVAISADGSRVASSGAGAIEVWDTRTEQLRWTLSFGDPLWTSQLDLDADGGLLALGGSGPNDTTVRLYDAASGQPLREVKPPGSQLNGLVLNRDGTLLATLTSTDSSTLIDFYLRLWDTRAGQEVFADDSQSDDYSLAPQVAFSSSEPLMAYTSTNTTHLYDTDSKQEWGTLPRPAGTSGLALHPDGSQLAVTVVQADNGYSTRVFDIPSGKELQQLKDVSVSAWSDDGSALLTIREDVYTDVNAAPRSYYAPTVLDAGSYAELGRYFSGALKRFTLETTPTYVDELHYRVAGTLQLEGEEALPFEGTVQGNESQRYLSAQARLPTPTEFELTVEGQPWTLQGRQDWVPREQGYEQAIAWTGYLDDPTFSDREWSSAYLEFERVSE